MGKIHHGIFAGECQHAPGVDGEKLDVVRELSFVDQSIECDLHGWVVEGQAVDLNIAFQRQQKSVEVGMGVRVFSVDFNLTNDRCVPDDVGMEWGELTCDGNMTFSLRRCGKSNMTLVVVQFGSKYEFSGRCHQDRQEQRAL